MELGLKGKVVAVTGGSEGIGRATVQRFVAEGAKVAFCARRKDVLDKLADDMRKQGGDVLALAADASKKGEMENFIDAVAKHFGRLDVVVNNAGGSGQVAFEKVDEAVWDNDIAIKVYAQIRTTRAAVPHMKKQGWGRIINISGTNARNAGNLSGGARNASMVHMTKTLAVQLGRFGITVNCVHPGTTRTERTPSLLAKQAAEQNITPAEVEKRTFAPDAPRGNAICRMVDASEIAYVTSFLASEKSWAICGELIVATGGAGKSVYY